MTMKPERRKPEPQPRDDGRCVVCEKKVPLLPHHGGDAFCSTVCCRAYFGTTLLINTSTKP